MKKIIFVLIGILFMCGCSSSASYKDITVEEVHSMMSEDVIVLDVRSSLEFKQGHIENSINADVDGIFDVESIIPDKDKKIIVYCKSGNRSKTASEKLIKLGYTDVYNMLGGINNWKYEVIQ